MTLYDTPNYYLSKLKDSSKRLLAGILSNAARDIQVYGWKNNGSTESIDPYGKYPRCVWLGFQRSLERARRDNLTKIAYEEVFSKYGLAGEEALCAVAGAPNLGELFRLNDSKSEEEGKDWAVKVLQKASALVLSGVKEVDTDSTAQTDSGNVTSAPNYLGVWRKLFKRAR